MSAASESRTPARPSPAGIFSKSTAVSLEQRIGFVLALGAAVVALAALVTYVTLAFNWAQKPFVGVFFTETMVIDGTRPVEPATWSGLEAGLRRLDRITGINGELLTDNPENLYSAFDGYERAAESFKFDRVIRVNFDRPARDGVVTASSNILCGEVSNGFAPCTVSFPLRHFPGSDFIALFVIPFISSVILMISALALLRFRAHQPIALVTSTLCSAQAIFTAGLFDNSTTHMLTDIWLLATPVMGACFISLALTFPTKSPRLYAQPLLRYAPFVFSTLLTLVVIYFDSNPPYPEFVIDNFFIAIMGAVIGLIVLTISMIRRRNRAASASMRDQANIVLLGIALASAPIFVWIVNVVTRPILGYEPLSFNTSASTPFFILPALSLTYAIFQYRMRGSDRLLSQAITYAMLLFALVFGYFLLVFGASLIVGEFVAPTDTVLMAFVIFCIALFFVPFRTRLQQRVDELYFRQRRNYQVQIEAFAQKLTTLVQTDEVMTEYRKQLEEGLAPTHLFIFLPNWQTGEFVAFGTPRPETDVRFAADSHLFEVLRKNEQFIYLEPGRPWPPELLVERARLLILNTLVIVGLPGSQAVNGFVSIGPPRSGAGEYPYEALRFARNLTQQISVAVERSQVVSSLERRVRELDVLSQVSQAMNFTLDFDDLLELISTQADKLVDSTHFYIVLRDSETDELYYAFFLEDEERYPEKENRRWPMGRDLYSEIVRTGQSIRVANYARALMERDVSMTVEDPELKAWMGVPLIAGSRTLGVLAAGTSHASQSYNDEQLKIFGDIAALAATSLDKARLFDETNSRARQLAALNDISRQLVAVESDLEKLLTFITQNAVEILNAEAGSLLLTTDDNTGDLEFKVVTGGSGQQLIGTRLPAKRGLVGHVAATGEVVIVNNAATDPRWGGELSQGAFQTSSVLAVPLITQNRVIGVLELLNKKDGAFRRDDSNLLTTFAGQAAVAIENARLFQMTDLQLSERVSELEALERIDVELNRSLDLKRVGEITLQNSMEKSGATAGLLGLVMEDGKHMQIVAMEGYAPDDMPEGEEDGIWPIDKGIVSRVMRTKRADLTPDVKVDPNYVPSLRNALSQITVPMLSGGTINAILILETDKEPRFNLVHMAFVQRLAEHASIAIANAQLYAELNRANQSKSEFVSFVAHELKNPLASIKGYSTLLTSGMAGNLSDQQRDFLGRITFNAERMNTLVSDLNDVTQLEVNKRLRIEKASISFHRVVTETLRPFEKQLQDKEQTLVVEVDAALPNIDADQNRMIQVMTNLISNAHKYSPAGGTITVGGEIVNNRRDAKGRPLGPMLHAWVSDTGIGMSEEDLKKLFTKYFRSENPLAQEQPGTGLGLTITRGIIEGHGGEIWVESELGKGTTFHFTVPLAPEQVAK